MDIVMVIDVLKVLLIKVFLYKEDLKYLVYVC